MSEPRALRRWAPLAAIVLLGSALRFWRLGDLALLGDESYYWLWSRRLDWAYYDHPAGVAVLTWLSTALGGQSEIGVRWLNALLGLGCIPLTYALGTTLVGRRAGHVAALAVATGAPYLLTSRFVYTDALQLFLLLLTLLWFWRLVSEVPRPRLATCVGLGVSMALLFNTKYSAYLCAVALALTVLVDHRHILADRRFWLAGLLAALGLLPVLTWNAAHDWASLRWQLSHAGFSLTGRVSLLGSAHHSLSYLTWPLVVWALAGLGLALAHPRAVHRPAARLLTLVALFLLVPIALSPANSPRNLGAGLVPLLLLAGARWPAANATTCRSGEERQGPGRLPQHATDSQSCPQPRESPKTIRNHKHRVKPDRTALVYMGIRRTQRWLATLLGLIMGLTALYGLGTVVHLSGPSKWPHSSAVPEIRRDAAGWRALGSALSEYTAPAFALDYSIASQIWFYTGRPAYTAWQQYQIWGVPHVPDWTIVSLDYIPEDLVTASLHDAFQAVEGPRRLLFQEPGATKKARIWQVEGLHLDPEAFLQQFDFLVLLEAAR